MDLVLAQRKCLHTLYKGRRRSSRAKPALRSALKGQARVAAAELFPFRASVDAIMPLTYWNVLIFAAILVGARFHANRALHSRWMIGCFLADLALLATVEFVGRSAVGEAADRMFETGQDRTMTLIHVLLAVAGLVLWFPMILAGRRLLRGDETARESHKRYLPWFLVCRLGNAVTAFFVI